MRSVHHFFKLFFMVCLVTEAQKYRKREQCREDGDVTITA
jgi:hypothetical protein